MSLCPHSEELVDTVLNNFILKQNAPAFFPKFALRRETQLHYFALLEELPYGPTRLLSLFTRIFYSFSETLSLVVARTTQHLFG